MSAEKQFTLIEKKSNRRRFGGAWPLMSAIGLVAVLLLALQYFKPSMVSVGSVPAFSDNEEIQYAVRRKPEKNRNTAEISRSPAIKPNGASKTEQVSRQSDDIAENELDLEFLAENAQSKRTQFAIELAKEAQIFPLFNPDVGGAVLILNFDSEAPGMQALGFEDGDMVTHINGEAISFADDGLFKLVMETDTSSIISLDIIRDGTKLTRNVSLSDFR
jgi:hypothetical protein